MNGIGHSLFNYDGMYENEDERNWRELCARDKVKNQLPVYSLIQQNVSFKILEVGCGDGAIARELGLRGVYSEYIGVDISSSGISAARSLEIPKANFLCLSANEILNYDCDASVTLLCHVIEHLLDPRSLLLKARDWSDYLIVEVPLEDNVRMGEDYDWNPVGHINKFKISTIRILVQTCGWEIVACRMYNPSRQARTFFMNDFTSNISWLLKEFAFRTNQKVASRLFTYHYILLAKRKD